MRERSIYMFIRYTCSKRRLVIGLLTFTVSHVMIWFHLFYWPSFAPAPFNLLALIIFRPLRLIASGNTLRHGRIVLLRATHAPIVALIQAYEWIATKLNLASTNTFRGPQQIFSKRHIVPPPSRPQSSYRPYIPSPRPGSAGFNKQKWESPVEDDTTNAPTDVEARIADLSAKIDRLTTLVASLQPTPSTSTQQWI